jgi:hypothetical protein
MVGRWSAESDSTVRVAREWLRQLPSDCVKVREDDCEFEYVIDVQPRNARASPVEIRIGKEDGCFDIAAGRALQFSDIPQDAAVLWQVLDAVRDGKLREDVVEQHGRILCSKGELELPTGKWFSRRCTFWGALINLVRRQDRTITYEPYC